jgi:hypothetical protein
MKNHGKYGSVGFQVLTQELLNTKQKCQPLDVILTISNYDIFHNTSQVIFVMGWWCFLLRQKQKRLTQSQAGLQNAPTAFTIYADVYPAVPMYNSRTSKRVFIKFDISVFLKFIKEALY